MLLRKLVVVGLVGFVSFAANIATAEDAVGPNAYVGASGVSFADSNQALPDRFQIRMSDDGGNRFSAFAPSAPTRGSVSTNDRRYEVELVAHAGHNIDVGVAQRGGVGFNQQGDVERQSRGTEFRLGRLANVPRDHGSSAPRWYVFAGSQDEALMWRPGGGADFAGPSFALQNRVEIGDRQAGVTYEANGWQASFAYVEREIKTRVGNRNFNQDEDFTGVTLTMRH